MDFLYALGGAIVMLVGVLIGYAIGDRTSNKKQKDAEGGRQ